MGVPWSSWHCLVIGTVWSLALICTGRREMALLIKCVDRNTRLEGALIAAHNDTRALLLESNAFGFAVKSGVLMLCFPDHLRPRRSQLGPPPVPKSLIFEDTGDFERRE